MQEFEEDLYAILGVEETSTTEEVRKAYLTLAKRLHPDRFPNDPEQRAVAQTEFAKVTRAHDVISDPARRSEYDTLRELSKNRGAQHQPEEVKPVSLGAGDAAVSQFSATRPTKAPTSVEEENINIKWANKHLTRADELFKAKRFQEAETAMKEAIRLVPNETRYHNKLAEIYLARGWKTLAMTEVQASLRIDPKDLHSKTLQAKINQLAKTAPQAKVKNGFLGQLKGLFSKKKR